MRWRVGVVALVALACAHPAPRAQKPLFVLRRTPEPPPLRLPATLVPKSYRVQLAVDRTQLVGTVQLAAELTQASDTLWLHEEGLSIASAIAITSGGQRIALEPRAIRTYLALLAPTPLPAGSYTIAIAYTAPIDDLGDITAEAESYYPRQGRRDGVFREHAGTDSYVFTMFEPMAARRAFPCLDEPSFKVPWQLTLDVPAGETALSNAPEVARHVLPTGRTRIEFAPTAPLPSYLIAFAVGPFELVDAGTSRTGVPLRIAVRKGRTGDAAWAVRLLARTLQLVEDYTQIPLPYPKLDIVAVPVTGDNWAGMENAGLIAIRESVVRADGTAASSPAGLVSMFAHEIAHQWFGDYATPAWWNDLWLNETFAAWLADKISAQFDARWGAELVAPRPAPQPPPPRDRRLLDSRVAYTVRAPLSETRNSAALQPYFDGNFGMPVLLMFEGLVGADRFRDLLRDYLRAHAHGTVRTADLATSVAAASNLPLDKVFARYLDDTILRPPQIDITASCAPAQPPRLVFDQRPTIPPSAIPVCLAYETASGRGDLCLVFDAHHDELPVPGGHCPRWVVPNVRSGLYTPAMHDVAAILTLAWPALTLDERLAVARDADWETTDQLAVALRLLDEQDRRALQISATALARFVRYVPDALRAQFNERVRAKVRATARLARVDDLRPTRERFALWVALMAGDPESVRRERAELVGLDERDQLANLFGWTALLADPVAAGAALERLAAGDPRIQGYRLIDTLASNPVMLSLIEARPLAFAAIEKPTQLRLLTTRCEPSQRADVVRLATTYFGREANVVTRDFDACAAKRATLEPVFRAWLATP